MPFRFRAKVWRALFFAPFFVVLSNGLAADDGSSHPTTTANLPIDNPLGPDGLPVVLTASEARLYREIFALQEAGDLTAADAKIAQLDDRLLMGHLQAQRYLHPTAHRSSFEELRDWLLRYSDHPDALRIHRLALTRKPAEAEVPAAPVLPSFGLPAAADGRAESYRPVRERSEEEAEQVRDVKRLLRGRIAERRFRAARLMLDSPKLRALLDPVEIDWAFGRIANGWFIDGNDERALELAQQAARHSGSDVPSAHWVAGLAAWRLGETATAARHFESVARSPRASSWMTSAGAFWAGRAHQALDHPGHAIRWFMRAADHQRTFYGLLATRALGMEMPFDFRPQRLTKSKTKRLTSSAAGRRMLALMQVGQRGRAESEMVLMLHRGDPQMAEALLGLAESSDRPSLSFRLAARMTGDRRFGRDGVNAGLYPLPPWQPDEGFRVDRALVFAFMRHESQYQPDAASKDGARGLMQIMPTTAEFIAEASFAGKEELLFDPVLNVDLGQRYLAYLLGIKAVNGDLFHLAAAYNGGPGNLGKWKRQMGREDDPLLFIESLPSGETRAFIERVLTNLWIYRARLGQPTPALDALVAGDWPTYIPLDANSLKLAIDGQN